MASNNRPFIYLPVLKWKPGEMATLRGLDSIVKCRVLPLVEVQPPSLRRDEMGLELPPKPLALHLQETAEEIAANWGINSDVIVDIHPLLAGPMAAINGETVQEYLFSCLRRERVPAIPVVTPEDPPESLERTSEIIQRDEKGACLRVRSFNWPKERIEFEFASLLQTLLAKLKTLPSGIDVVIDAGDVKGSWREAEASFVQALINALPKVDDWRSLVLASCGFPASLAVLQENETHIVPRYDWQMWKAITSGEYLVTRLPLFGDYGVNHPSQGNAVASGPRPTVAQIRYTADDFWICIKGTYINDIVKLGQLVRSGCGNGQYVDMARVLVKNPAFKGKEFSKGDCDILAIAEKRKNPGVPMIWRGIGANHHITFAVKQIGQLGDV